MTHPDQPEIQANFAFIDRFSPFFFCIDQFCTIVEVGRSLRKILNWQEDATPFSELLRIRFPYKLDLNYEVLFKTQGTVMVFDIKGKRSQLKGEFVALSNIPGKLTFIGSLLLNPNEQMQDLKLSLADFPSNDNSSNLLFSLMAQQSTLEEVTGLTRALQRQSQELLEVNQELMQYTHAVSHDLKTPLRSITSFMQLLRRSFDQLTPVQEEYVGFIMQGASRMEQLINDLSVHSGIRDRPVRMEEVDTEALIHEVAKGLVSQLNEFNGQIEITPLPVVMGDKNRLYQLFSNLLQNSLKYRSEKAPLLQVEALKEDDHWVFRFTDNGIGIDKAFQSKIFKPFTRLHNYSSIEGSGLGLAICQKIVEQHFGEISVDSDLGKGATFIVRLPVSIPETTPAPAPAPSTLPERQHPSA
ncbi:ATP-binding protein [Phaeodactylibacter sp.]|uniref:ATP-binding protein n=1 Tax=Phaeodactylibacter sp. TaxID=1940289 RepID=UPI0025F1EE24|nr:ATP-binding protein [Phaeodactylibacter sp.]MCI4647785.1 ATP-binding protein [Phaeodactylibacter sp.]MCI5090521.1 ATP-binding protein [Phaeodactylibacter sp.]